MAKTKNKNKRKVHQPQKYITRLQAKQAMVEHFKKNAVEEIIAKRVFTSRQREMYLAILAIHEAFGIGEYRILSKFVPAMMKAHELYGEWSRDDNEFYADQKLAELVKRICPSQEFTIGDGVLSLDNGEYIE